jgi:hypothetical protein
MIEDQNFIFLKLRFFKYIILNMQINLPIIIWPYMDLEKIQWAPQEQKLEERINYGFCKSGNLISKVNHNPKKCRAF